MSWPTAVVGTLHGILDTVGASTVRSFGVLMAVLTPLLLYNVIRILFPTVESREPPILRPKIPFFGHVISLICENTRMFDRLYRENAMPICTLPMLNGSIYVINDPALIAAAMRNRSLSLEPFNLEFAVSTMGMTPRHLDLFSAPGRMVEILNIHHSSLSHTNLAPMNVRALAHIADCLNAIPAHTEGLEVPDLYDWLRKVASMATMKALFGKNNPLTYEDVKDIGEFEKGLGVLAMTSGLTQRILAPRALAARRRGQERLRRFYVHRLDEGEDVSALIRDRAAMERRLGIPDDELSIIEFSMPFAAITNTIPALFWLFVHVFSDRNITALVRAEIEAVASVSKERPADSEEVQDRVVLEAARLEKECPTLHACYRESLRLYSDQLGNRRVVADTTVRASDVAGGSGREYLLRCGGHVQWPTAVVHRMESIWGSDAREFHFERFLNDGSNGNSTGNGTTNGNGKVSGKRGQHHGMDEGYRKLNGAHAESEEADRTRKRREALIPFGGGRNLCPGRNFAACEMLSLVAAIAVGFDIDGVYVPPATSPNWGAAIQRPDFDNTAPPHVSIRRRMSWDRVVFELKC